MAKDNPARQPYKTEWFRRWRAKNPELAKSRDRKRNQERYWKDPKGENKKRHARRDPVKEKSRLKKYSEDNRNHISALQRRNYHAGGFLKDKFKHIKRKYGLSQEEYEAMLKSQDSVCAICRLPNTEGRRMSVDHNHANGKVRGLLCMTCNAGLGCFKDNENLLLAGMQYLRERN